MLRHACSTKLIIRLTTYVPRLVRGIHSSYRSHGQAVGRRVGELIFAMLLIGAAFAFSTSAWAFDTSTAPPEQPAPVVVPPPPPPSYANAESAPQVAGFGQVATNILEPVTIASSFMSGISIVIGMTSLFSAFLRYMQHRVNPLAQPISTVILLVVLGVILIALPLIYKLTESGIPFSMK